MFSLWFTAASSLIYTQLCLSSAYFVLFCPAVAFRNMCAVCALEKSSVVQTSCDLLRSLRTVTSYLSDSSTLLFCQLPMNETSWTSISKCVSKIRQWLYSWLSLKKKLSYISLSLMSLGIFNYCGPRSKYTSKNALWLYCICLPSYEITCTVTVFCTYISPLPLHLVVYSRHVKAKNLYSVNLMSIMDMQYIFWQL